MIYSCDISYKITLGENLKLPHQGNGVVIGPDTVIGDNVTIYQHVTLGAKANGESYSAPIIGNNVMLGAGCVILGNVSIGNNCLIGANAVVTENVPDNCTVVGIPGKIIKRGDRE